MKHGHREKPTIQVLSIFQKFLLLISLLALTPKEAYAAKTQLTIEHDRTDYINVEKDKTTISISQTITLHSNKRNIYLPPDNTDITYVCPYSPANKQAQLEEIKNTLKVEVTYPKKHNIAPEVENAGDCLAIKYPYSEKLRVGQKLKFKLGFTLRSVNLATPPLELNIQQALKNKRLQQGNYNIQLTYSKTAQVTVPASVRLFDLTTVSSTRIPKVLNSETKSTFRYNIPPGVLSKQNVLLVLGNQTVAEYIINIQLEQQSLLNQLSEIDTPLPLDRENYNQKVFLDNASHELVKKKIVQIDPKGFLNVTTHSDIEFRTIVINKTPRNYATSRLNRIKIDETPREIYTKWLNPKLYPIQSPAIHKLLDDVPESPYILENVKNIVQKVIDTLEYDKDFLKAPRDRLSVQNAIIAGQGVCMEYADLTITLLQARGIAARPAYGYLLYTSDLSGANLGDYGHQWVEVYFPSVGWIPVDPTLAETIPNYINLPMAYLFITNQNEALTSHCMGFLNSCNNTVIKTRLHKISTLKFTPKVLTPLATVISATTQETTSPASVINNTTRLSELASQLMKPFIELIPLQIWWSLPIIILLSIIYTIRKRIRARHTL